MTGFPDYETCKGIKATGANEGLNRLPNLHDHVNFRKDTRHKGCNLEVECSQNYKIAIMVQLKGSDELKPCKKCAEGVGAFITCRRVRLPNGNWALGGVCSNCFYRHHGKECDCDKGGISTYGPTTSQQSNYVSLEAPTGSTYQILAAHQETPTQQKATVQQKATIQQKATVHQKIRSHQPTLNLPTQATLRKDQKEIPWGSIDPRLTDDETPKTKYNQMPTADRVIEYDTKHILTLSSLQHNECFKLWIESAPEQTTIEYFFATMVQNSPSLQACLGADLQLAMWYKKFEKSTNIQVKHFLVSELVLYGLGNSPNDQATRHPPKKSFFSWCTREWLPIKRFSHCKECNSCHPVSHTYCDDCERCTVGVHYIQFVQHCEYCIRPKPSIGSPTEKDGARYEGF